MKGEARVERWVRIVMVAVARLSAAMLFVGLGWWMARPDAPSALWLLDAGIVLLMSVPLLRVAQSAARGIALKDWLHVATIAAVAAMLAASILYAVLR